PHHLVGVWPLDHDGDVAQYAAAAHEVVDEIISRGRVPIVVGGSGLYMRAALADLFLPPEPLAGLRARLQEAYDRDGPARTHARLASLDAPAADAVHPNDRRRVVRALELHELGHSLRPSSDELWTSASRHPTARFGVAVPRTVLHQR